MSYTAFSGSQLLASGAASALVTALKALGEDAQNAQVFDDSTGRTVDFDLRGSLAEALARLPADAPSSDTAQPVERSGPGRPKLGVVAREVTLLPRHWDWLAAQPGGASVVLRRLVEAASRATRAKDQARASQEACHRVMTALAGDQAGYEAAIRALFANRFDEVRTGIATWPADIRDYLFRLLQRAQEDAFEARED